MIIKSALLNRWGISGHDIEDSAVDHVEEVHHDEALEHEGLVFHSPSSEYFITKFDVQLRAEEVVRDICDLRASVHEDEHGDDLVDGLRKDSTHHRLCDQRILNANTFFTDISGVRSFS